MNGYRMMVGAALLAVAVAAQADRLRLPNGKLLSKGDDVMKVYQALGEPISRDYATGYYGHLITQNYYEIRGRLYRISTAGGKVAGITASED